MNSPVIQQPMKIYGWILEFPTQYTMCISSDDDRRDVRYRHNQIQKLYYWYVCICIVYRTGRLWVRMFKKMLSSQSIGSSIKTQQINLTF